MPRRIAVVVASNGPPDGTLVQLRYAVTDGKNAASALASPTCGFEVEFARPEDPEAVRSLLFRTAESCEQADVLWGKSQPEARRRSDRSYQPGAPASEAFH